jgi:hypothetical protein
MHPEKNKWESYRQHHRTKAKQQEAALQKREKIFRLVADNSITTYRKVPIGTSNYWIKW